MSVVCVTAGLRWLLLAAVGRPVTVCLVESAGLVAVTAAFLTVDEVALIADVLDGVPVATLTAEVLLTADDAVWRTDDV